MQHGVLFSVQTEHSCLSFHICHSTARLAQGLQVAATSRQNKSAFWAGYTQCVFCCGWDLGSGTTITDKTGSVVVFPSNKNISATKVPSKTGHGKHYIEGKVYCNEKISKWKKGYNPPANQPTNKRNKKSHLHQNLSLVSSQTTNKQPVSPKMTSVFCFQDTHPWTLDIYN